MTFQQEQWSPPAPWREHAIAVRANFIRDPARRLRFLRRSAAPTRPRRRRRHRLLQALLLGLAVLVWPPPTASDANGTRLFRSGIALPPGPAASPVWLVDTQNGLEIYSNGLRIETRFQTEGRTRSYLIYDGLSESREVIDSGARPAGIVFHSTESLQAPFEAGQNGALRRIGENLLTYVRSRRSYNYVIDRFGRVWRIVPDLEVANHAGWSVWASGGRVWVNLNRSFLGISLESRTDSVSAGTATPAQIHSARILTELLRAKYRIPVENCVTHAQVSVSPATLGLGYHTDWVAGFPFEELGLSANYSLPPAALFVFGFGYDPSYAEAGGEPMQAGLRRAEEALRQEATARGIPPQEWRLRLQRKYRQIRTALQTQSTAEENDIDER